MTLTNTVVAKLSVAFVAIAMMFSLVAPAQAQTAEELQATIDSLMAQINELNAQLGVSGGSSVSSADVCPYTWTRSLSSGSTGADVMALQQFLNGSADTQVSASGAGAPGMETSYYGPATAAAVSNFQVKYRADILSPVGLVNPTGYFGPSTMAKANELCVAATADDTMDDSDDDASEDEDDSDEDELMGGESDVTITDVDGDEDQLREGEEDVPVMVVTIDVEDGDARLERADIALEQTAGSGAEDEPWEAFDEISIWVDGDKVASEDVTDEDDWDDNYSAGSSFTDGYTFRMTDIDTIFREDGEYDIVFALSTNSSFLDNGEADTWDMALDDDGLRFVDGEGINIEVGDADDEIEFEVEDQSAEDYLSLDSSDNDPDATTLQVDDDDEKEHMIFAFVLNAEDGENDITFNDITIDVEINSDDVDFDTVDELVDDFYITIGGETFDATAGTWNAASGTEQAILFDIDEDYTLDGGEEVEVEVWANFNDVDANFATASIQASVDKADIDAEGAEDIATVDIEGSARTGEEHTLRLNGLIFGSEPTDGTDNGDSTATTQDTVDNSFGEMFLEFEIEVFGDDLWVPIQAATAGAADTSSGLTYQVLDGNGNATTTFDSITTDWDIVGANEDNSYYELVEGETYTVTVNIESLNPEVTGLYSFRVNSIGFNATEDTAPDASGTPADPSEYESDAVSIQS